MTEADESTQVPSRRGGLRRLVRDWLLVIAIAVGAALLVRTFLIQQFYISGPSMQPTLFTNDRVLVNKLSYRLHSIRRGDVVVFDRVTTNGGTVAHDDLIKRVIAVGEDKIEIKKCDVYVNAVAIDEPYLDPEDVAQKDLAERCRVADMPKMTVPDGEIFVMGDNRPESFDSRSFGTISVDLVVGRAFVVVWPFARLGGL